MKKSMSIVVIMLVAFIFFTAGWWSSPDARETENILSHEGKEAFDLMAHWSQGNIVALVRHTERCDKSDNECLDGKDGITVPGKEMSLKLGRDFRALLNLDHATVFNSPVKRTAQTAHFMFGNASRNQKWLADDCEENFLKDIFDYKEPGKNLVLVTHSTCINSLGDIKNGALLVLNENDKRTYGLTVFLAVDQVAKQAHVLGYLYPEDWGKALNNKSLPGS